MTDPRILFAYTENIRQLTLRAKEFVMQFRHTHVAAEHILLAILSAESPGVATILAKANATPQQIQELVLHHLRAGDAAVAEEAVILGERAKRVIECARQEALQAHAPQIAPEHVLLGLTQVPNTVSGAVLRAVGITTESAREALGQASPPAQTPIAE